MANQKKKTKKKVDDKVFDMMTTVADKTDVNLEESVGQGKNTDSIHNALMAAGMTPAYGNIADLADATLYALEGELGKAAWSAAAALPIIGQMVSSRRALKIAKEAGEEMVTLYRGVNKWHPGKMVKKGNFIGGAPLTKEHHKILNFNIAEGFITKTYAKHLPYKKNVFGLWSTTERLQAGRYTKLGSDVVGRSPIILEFQVPRSFIKRSKSVQIANSISGGGKGDIYLFMEGLPKGFLKKVHESRY